MSENQLFAVYLSDVLETLAMCCTYIHVHNVRIGRIYMPYCHCFPPDVYIFSGREKLNTGLTNGLSGQMWKIRKMETGDTGGMPGFGIYSPATKNLEFF